MLSELLAHDAAARELARFLQRHEQLQLLALSRESVHSALRRHFFAQMGWKLPPVRWLARQVLRRFTMRSVVTYIVVSDASWQQHLLVTFPALVHIKVLQHSAVTAVDLVPRLLPPTLKHLDLSEFGSADMAAIVGLTQLEKLELPLDDPVLNIQMLTRLPSLRMLALGSDDGGAGNDLSVVEGIPNLTELDLRYKKVDMSPLTTLRNLKRLVITGCVVRDIKPLLAVAATLTELDASDVRVKRARVSSDDINAFIALLTSTAKLNLFDSKLVPRSLAPFTELMKLRELHLSNSYAFDDFSPLAALTELESLRIHGTLDADWSPIRNLINLKRLNQEAACVNSSGEMARVLEKLPKLEELIYPVAISHKCKLPQVRLLAIRAGLREDVVPDLNADCLPKLRSLRLVGCVDVSRIDFSKFGALRVLNMAQLVASRNAMTAADCCSIAHLTQLEELSISVQVQDYSFLTELVNLEELQLMSQSIDDLSVLSRMERLRHLNLYDTLVDDISPLADLHSLCELTLDRTKVTDVSSLCELPLLSSVVLPDQADCAPLVKACGTTLPNLKSVQHYYLDCLWRGECSGRGIHCCDAGTSDPPVQYHM